MKPLSHDSLRFHEKSPDKSARFWTAPALWRFWQRWVKTARGLAQSRTLSRELKDFPQ
jgi:uncharacterized protein YjiS (DUF1127 family)